MKKMKLIIPILLLLVVGALMFFFWQDTKDPYANFSVKACDLSIDDQIIPKFEEVKVNFKHEFDKKSSLPVLGSCLIDIDNDGIDELFVGGGANQTDALFEYKNGKFVDISNEAGFSPKKENTLGAVSYDFDQNGLMDLIICRDDGVYLLSNNEGTFHAKKLNVPLNEKTSPVSVTLGDINNDGHIDMFVAGYIKKHLMEGQTIFNDKKYGGSSIVLLNNGNNSFKDITASSGMTYIHNTFQAMFVDVNKDKKLDIVVAYDTGEPRIYINQNGTSFKLKSNPHTGKFSYPMGIAIGDYDNNQTPDFFFSNTGSSVPKMMAKGDLTKEQTLFTDWILLKNDGHANFTEAGKETKIADFEFSWGAIFEDFNLDGRQDLVVAENYIAFPPQALFKLPCRFLIQLGDGTFAAVEQQSKVVNKNYAITPLSSDFNNDGYPDLVYVNLDGEVKAYINKGGKANYIKVRLKDNPTNIGAEITVFNGDDRQTSYNVIGEGLCSDQSNTHIFGFWENDKIDSVVIRNLSDSSVVFKEIDINTTLIVD